MERNTYEKVVGNEVVETVMPNPGDYEDTRLGLLALDYRDGQDGWRLKASSLIK